MQMWGRRRAKAAAGAAGAVSASVSNYRLNRLKSNLTSLHRLIYPLNPVKMPQLSPSDL